MWGLRFFDFRRFAMATSIDYAPFAEKWKTKRKERVKREWNRFPSSRIRTPESQRLRLAVPLMPDRRTHGGSVRRQAPPE
ncbi:MAG: hypothetical protein ACLFSZ_10475, partial [Puniceicoccaceae bacterium]